MKGREHGYTWMGWMGCRAHPRQRTRRFSFFLCLCVRSRVLSPGRFVRYLPTLYNGSLVRICIYVWLTRQGRKKKSGRCENKRPEKAESVGDKTPLFKPIRFGFFVQHTHTCMYVHVQYMTTKRKKRNDSCPFNPPTNPPTHPPSRPSQQPASRPPPPRPSSTPSARCPPPPRPRPRR